MTNTSQKNLAVVLFLAVFLTACGGGGDSNNSPASNDSPPQSQDNIISEPITSPPVIAPPDDQPKEPTDIPVDIGSAPVENNAQAALSVNNQFSLA